MQDANPLEQLRDIHLPAEISWWPLAYGWWLSILLGLLILGAITITVHRHLKTRKYRQFAINELDELYQLHQNETEFIKHVARLLKRVCTHYIDSQSARLHSKAWLNFLIAQCPDANTPSFETICLQQYKKTIKVDRLQVYQDTKYWLKKHRKTTC